MACVWLESTSAEKSQAAERTALESATSIATEAIVGVRTVQSLGEICWSKCAVKKTKCVTFLGYSNYLLLRIYF